MNLYRLHISLAGRLATPLIGDTLFGHFVWGIARREGQEAASAFIDQLGERPFIVSSAFPRGYVPKPLLSHWSDDREVPAYQKKLKKLKYIPLELLLSGEPINAFTFKDLIDKSPLIQKGLDRLHATVDRWNEGTLEETGLFASTEYWFGAAKPGGGTALFDIYILSIESTERVVELSQWAFENGFGADASTGAGKIEILGLEETKFPENGNRAMVLGPFVLSPSQMPKNLCANIFVRRGKISLDFNEITNPFKKPIVFYEEGGTFVWEEGMLPYIGEIVKNVHSDPRIIQQGWAPVLRFNEATS